MRRASKVMEYLIVLMSDLPATRLNIHADIGNASRTDYSDNYLLRRFDRISKIHTFE